MTTRDSSHCEIGFVSTADPEEVKTWSGTPHYMLRAVQREFRNVEIFAPVRSQSARSVIRALKLKDKLLNTRSIPAMSLPVSRLQARSLKRRIGQRKVDALLVVASAATIAGGGHDWPVIYTSDATVRLMKDYYPEFTGTTHRSFDVADWIEGTAIRRAAAIIYPSQWAAQSAIEDYGADPDKIFIHPYGANLQKIPDRQRAIKPRKNDILQLLFVGVDWTRKGGQIAVDCLQRLNAAGIATHLSIVGTVPPNDVPRNNLTVYPFIDKSDPIGEKKMAELYLGADLLFVPTRAECQGIIWCEAAAHGVPSISTDTGGVATTVKDGVNGQLLSYHATGSDYCNTIRSIVETPGYLDALRESSRSDFDTRLNWRSWASTFRRAYEETFERSDLG